MPPLRIALVTSEYPGCGPSHGIGCYLHELVTGLHARGCALLVLVVNGSGRYRGEDGAPPRRVGDQPGPAALIPWRAGAWLSRELGAWRPQVVEGSNWGGLGARLAGPWPRVVRLSTPVRWSPPPRARSRLTLPLHQHWEALSLRRADAVIADSAAMAAGAERVYARRVDVVIPHGCDFAEQRRPAAMARGDDILVVGRLEQRKGIDRLLRAWPAVHRRHPDVSLHLVGDDRLGLAEQLPRAASLGIRIHGRLADADLAALRARCALQAVPSRFESFGLVVLEAWAAGLAVVTSADGALPEVVGDAGVVVSDGDWAAALCRLLDEPAARARLIARGHQRLTRRFARATMVAKSLALYRRLADAGDGASRARVA